MAFDQRGLQTLALILENQRRKVEPAAQRGHEMEMMNLQTNQMRLEGDIEDARFERTRLMEQEGRLQENLSQFGITSPGFDSEQMKLLADTSMSLRGKAEGLAEIANAKHEHLQQLRGMQSAAFAGFNYASKLAPEFVVHEGEVMERENRYSQLFGAINDPTGDVTSLLGDQLEGFESVSQRDSFIKGVETAMRDRSERNQLQQNAIEHAHLQKADIDRDLRLLMDQDDRRGRTYEAFHEMADRYKQRQNDLSIDIFNNFMTTIAASMGIDEAELTRRMRDERKEIREEFNQAVHVSAMKFAEDALQRSGFLNAVPDDKKEEQAEFFRNAFVTAYAKDAFNLIDAYVTNHASVTETITRSLSAFKDKVDKFGTVEEAIRSGELQPQDLAKVSAFFNHPHIFTSAETAYKTAEEFLGFDLREKTLRREASNAARSDTAFAKMMDKLEQVDTSAMMKYMEFTQEFGRIEAEVSSPGGYGELGSREAAHAAQERRASAAESEREERFRHFGESGRNIINQTRWAKMERTGLLQGNPTEADKRRIAELEEFIEKNKEEYDKAVRIQRIYPTRRHY